VDAAEVEIVPIRGVEEHLGSLRAGTTVTITASPKFGYGRTLDYAALVAEAGHRPVPHLAARQVRDEAELADIVARLGDSGVRDLYVIGGDVPEPAGAFTSAGQVLAALSEMDHGVDRIGVACYPEGHPAIADEALLEALRWKQSMATYMVSQLCFDAATLAGWVRRIRAAGVHLPLYLGIAAPMSAAKLLPLSMRIGVGSSLRYLTKQQGLVGRLFRGGSYRPDDLLLDLGDDLGRGDLRIEGLHVCTFNRLAATLAWQRELAGDEGSGARAQPDDEEDR
jgi:methylenetetrahydrofolate reductase (NADPH)